MRLRAFFSESLDGQPFGWIEFSFLYFFFLINNVSVSNCMSTSKRYIHPLYPPTSLFPSGNHHTIVWEGKGVKDTIKEKD